MSLRKLPRIVLSLVVSLVLVFYAYTAFDLIPVHAASLAYDTSGLAAYDTTNGFTTVSLAASAAGSIAVMFTWTGTGDNLSQAPTVDGNASTYIGQIDDGGQTIRAYYYLDPPTSSVTYRADTSNTGEGVEMTVTILSGAKQSGQPDSSATATGVTTMAMTTTVVADNSWLLGGARNRTTGVDPTAGSGTTFRVNGVGFSAYDSNGTVSSGSQSLNVSGASGNNLFGFVVSVAPDAVPDAVPPPAIFLSLELWTNRLSKMI